MLTLSFKSIEEELPKHLQEIIYMDVVLTGFADRAGVRQGSFTYEWMQIDDEGNATGEFAGYNEGDVQEDGWELVYYIADQEGDSVLTFPHSHWMSVDDYWKIIDGVYV